MGMGEKKRWGMDGEEGDKVREDVEKGIIMCIR